MPSTRQAGRPTERQTAVRPPTSRCRPRQPPARSPSGSRTARRSLRVETLISIRFIARRAKPVLGLCRRPGRQLDFAPDVAAHARPMHGELAAVEANLAFGRAPALADAVLAAAIR